MSEGAIDGASGSDSSSAVSGDDGSSVPSSLSGGADAGAVAGDAQASVTTGVLPDWAGELTNTDLSSWLAKKGDRFPTLEVALQSHMKLEEFRGVSEDKLIKIADKEDNEAWHGPGGIWEKLGRPTNADQYDLPKIEQTKELFDIATPFRNAMFAGGASKELTEAVFGAVFGSMTEFQTAYNTDTKMSMEQGMATLKKEWGGEFDANFSLAKKGASALGFDIDSQTGLNTLAVLEREIGTREFMHHMHQIGQRLGSHQAGQHGEAQAGADFMSPDQARTEREKLLSDDEYRKSYLGGDTEKIERITQLFKWENPAGS